MSAGKLKGSVDSEAPRVGSGCPEEISPIPEETIRLVVFHSPLFSEALPKHLRCRQRSPSCPAPCPGGSRAPWVEKGGQSAGYCH